MFLIISINYIFYFTLIKYFILHNFLFCAKIQQNNQANIFYKESVCREKYLAAKKEKKKKVCAPKNCLLLQ